ncbi:aminotransferase-like domain-containing protein [Roseomonas populi]|uniref:PLP-dependent aminotransferase family protein n=1 Tax=Roseomonas populi TaxID=3121582 RepID=A0ABT1XCT8_9PROT|nr:PLP-dependent aminotransferase family protein [Roseomonas pecuniae]MCR0985524.1 PLP-dependent aminotransferase family protein [Roseomonas pecuniae]
MDVSHAERAWVPRIEGEQGPIYLAIADAIGAAVARVELRPGERLPTHRALAKALGVDLTTVTRAYAEARRRGLLDARVGRGTFIRSMAPSPSLQATSDEFVDLGMNLPPLPEEPRLQDLLQQGLSRLLGGQEPRRVLSYRTGAGTADERAAGALWLRPVLGEVDPGRLLVCPGAQPALFAALSALAEPGDTVLADELTYPGLRAVAEQLGLRLAGVAADDEGMLPEAVEAAYGENRPKALYCIPTIQNPTTVTMPRERRQALAATAQRLGLHIVEDDAYGLLPSRPLPAIASFAPEITYYISTLSKVLSPALRMAYLVAPGGAGVERLGAMLRASVLMASPLLTGLFAEWMRDGTAGTVLSAIRKESAARQRLARELLPRASFSAHPEGLHLWLRLPPRWNRLDFTSHLRRQGGLGVVPSDAFSLVAPAPDSVRVSLGAAANRDDLRRAMTSLAIGLDRGGSPHFAAVV